MLDSFKKFNYIYACVKIHLQLSESESVNEESRTFRKMREEMNNVSVLGVITFIIDHLPPLLPFGERKKRFQN